MAFFDLLKRFRKNTDMNINEINEKVFLEDSLEIQEEVQKIKMEEDKLIGLENAKPNKYGNYLLTIPRIYTVCGINPVTGRKNKKVYEVYSEEEAFKKAESDGLSLPIEITSIEMSEIPEPTDRQLAYARDLGINVSVGACRWDVSELITRMEEYDYESAQIDHLNYLASKKCGASSLMGYHSAFRNLFWVGELRDRLAMYAYFIDQTEQGLSINNLNDAPCKQEYYAFADYAINDERIVKHFMNWCEDRNYSSQRTWGIYKDFKQYWTTYTKQ